MVTHIMKHPVPGLVIHCLASWVIRQTLHLMVGKGMRDDIPYSTDPGVQGKVSLVVLHRVRLQVGDVCEKYNELWV